MAKGKSGKRGTREPSDSLTVSLRSRTKSPLVRLTEIQDLRSFSFEPATRFPKLSTGYSAGVSVTHTPKKKAPGKKNRAQLMFTAPRETLVCVRRSRRKEVLFAKNKTGKRGQRKPRRTPWSNYRC